MVHSGVKSRRLHALLLLFPCTSQALRASLSVAPPCGLGSDLQSLPPKATHSYPPSGEELERESVSRVTSTATQQWGC